MRPTPRVLAVALLLSLSASACSLISESITSPSESILATGNAIVGSFTAMSNAIAKSSGAGNTSPLDKPAYVSDLRQYVVVFLQNGDGTTQNFQRGVSRIAESHGISHWEAEPATPWAIGQGLRDASWSEAEMSAFCAQVGADSPAAQLALEGWRSGS